MEATLQELKAHRHVIIGLLGAAVLLVLVLPVLRGYASLLGSPFQLWLFIQGFGALAPIVYVLVQITQIVFAPIPGQIVYVAGGYTFGAVAGIVYGMVGMAIGSFLAILVGDRLGRPFVGRVIREDTITAFDDLTETYGYTPYFLIFLLPGFPDDAVCLIGGMTSLDVRRLWVFALIGRVPEVVALTLAGNSLALDQTRLFFVLAAVVFVASVLALFFRQRIIHAGHSD